MRVDAWALTASIVATTVAVVSVYVTVRYARRANAASERSASAAERAADAAEEANLRAPWLLTEKGDRFFLRNEQGVTTCGVTVIGRGPGSAMLGQLPSGVEVDAGGSGWFIYDRIPGRQAEIEVRWLVESTPSGETKAKTWHTIL